MDPEQFASRVEPAWGLAPAAVRFATAGVDVQGSIKSSNGWLAVEIVGWGAGDESWSFGWHILEGYPGHDAVWHELDELLQQPIETEDGRRFHIKAACVDTGGDFQEQVTNFCVARQHRRIMAIKGANDAPGVRSPLWPEASSKTKRGAQALHRRLGKREGPGPGGHASDRAGAAFHPRPGRP